MDIKELTNKEKKAFLDELGGEMVKAIERDPYLDMEGRKELAKMVNELHSRSLKIISLSPSFNIEIGKVAVSWGTVDPDFRQVSARFTFLSGGNKKVLVLRPIRRWFIAFEWGRFIFW